MIDTVKEKTGLKTLLAALEDNPFLDHGDGAVAPWGEEGVDSIFSISRAPKEPTAPAKPARTQPENGRAPDAPARASAEAERPGAPPAAAKPIAEDAVLKVLLQHGVLKEEQLSSLSAVRPAMPKGLPPWRAVLALPEVPHEKILAVAAHLHEVPFADLKQNPRYMLVTTLKSLPPAFRKKCFELRLLPFACGISEATGEILLKMASDDPLNPEVETFRSGLKMETQLYYAPAARLAEAVQSMSDELENPSDT